MKNINFCVIQCAPIDRKKEMVKKMFCVICLAYM